MGGDDRQPLSGNARLKPSLQGTRDNDTATSQTLVTVESRNWVPSRQGEGDQSAYDMLPGVGGAGRSRQSDMVFRIKLDKLPFQNVTSARPSRTIMNEAYPQTDKHGHTFREEH